MLHHREPDTERFQILPESGLSGAKLGLPCPHLDLQRPYVFP